VQSPLPDSVAEDTEGPSPDLPSETVEEFYKE